MAHPLTRSALLAVHAAHNVADAVATGAGTDTDTDTQAHLNQAHHLHRQNQPAQAHRAPPQRDRERIPTSPSALDTQPDPTRTMGDHERALLLWLQAESLDQFYTSVYNYFYGRGAACISLNRLAMLLRVAISTSLLVFLSSCIDYSKLHHLTGPTPLATVIDPVCPRIHPLMRAVLLLATMAWGWAVLQLWRDQVALRKMKDFFTHVLEIPDSDIQTASWSTILSRLEQVGIHHPHPSHTSLPAPPSPDATPDNPDHQSPPLGCSMVEIVARIMRRENYLIALFSTPGLLSLRVPVPIIGPALSPCLTRALQWTIEQCVLGVLFADARLWTVAHKASGQARKRVHRAVAEKLRHTFVIAAVASAVLGPFVLVGMAVYMFFRYGDEYYRNPSPLGSRTFTPLFAWQSRELNEMPHEHERRLARALVPANKYLNAFPTTKTAILIRLVAFTLGALASVLLAMSLVFPDTLLNLELTPERTPVYYLTLLGAALAVVRGMRGADPRVHADGLGAGADEAGAVGGGPDEHMHELVKYTHVCPRRWAVWGYRSDRTRQEVAGMVVPRAMVYVNEVVGMLVAPLVLGVAVRSRADEIVSFVMDRTVVVPGLGCVYAGALFDGRYADAGQLHDDEEDESGEAVVVDVSDDEGGLLESEQGSDERPTRRAAWDAVAHQKMTTSVIQFQENHPSWRPPAEVVDRLDRVEAAFHSHRADVSPAQPPTQMSRSRFLDSAEPRPPPPPIHVSIYESIMLSPAVRAEAAARSRVTSPVREPTPHTHLAPSSASSAPHPPTDLLDLGPIQPDTSLHPALAPRGFVAPATAPPVPSLRSHQHVASPSTPPSSATSDGAFVSPPPVSAAPIAILGPRSPPPVIGSPRRSYTGGTSLLSAQLQRSGSVASASALPTAVAEPAPTPGMMASFGVGSTAVTSEDMARMVHQFYVDDDHADFPPRDPTTTGAPSGWGSAAGGGQGRASGT